MDQIHITINELILNNKIEETIKLLKFVINTKNIIDILQKNMSLTCIGKNKDNKVDVVWLFYGDDIEMLKKYDSISFQPKLHLTLKSNSQFTIDYNKEIYRFDVGKSEEECKRLVRRKLEITISGNKNTLEYLNEDDSQIKLKEHRREQESFIMTRSACQKIDISIKHFIEDNYTSTDFRIDNYIKVQDKVAGKIFNMRNVGKYPYNPDSFDIFQITEIESKIVYAIPMRVININKKSVSFFSETELMKNAIAYSIPWKEKHSSFRYDLNIESDTRKYFDACKNAYLIPKLDDIKFFDNMIEKNMEKFGSRKQLANIE